MRLSLKQDANRAAIALFTISASFMWALFRPSSTFRLIESAPARLWEHPRSETYVALLVAMIVCALVVATLGRPRVISRPLIVGSSLVAAGGSLLARLSVVAGFGPTALLAVAGNMVLGVGAVLLWLCVMLLTARFRKEDVSIALVISYLLNCLYVIGLSLFPKEVGQTAAILFPAFMGGFLLATTAKLPESAAQEGAPKLQSQKLPRPLRHRLLFFVFCIYAGTAVWGLIFSTTTEEIAPYEHAITCIVSVMALLLVLGRTDRKNEGFAAGQSATVALVVLLGFGLFLAQLLQGENIFMATGVVTAALRCLKLFVWILLLEALVSRRSLVTRPFGLWFVLVEAVPPLLGNVAFPALITMLLPQAARNTTDILALCVMVLLFLSMIAFQNYQLNAAKNAVKQDVGEQGANDWTNSERQVGTIHVPSFKDACDTLAQSAGLAPREQEVMRLLARGYTQKRIAAELFMADGTVRGYIRTIYSKMGVHSKQELIDAINAEKNAEDSQKDY